MLKNRENGLGGNLHCNIVILIIIDKHMQMFCFKFKQNRTVNEEFYFFEGEGEEGPPGGEGLLIRGPSPWGGHKRNI